MQDRAELERAALVSLCRPAVVSTPFRGRKLAYARAAVPLIKKMLAAPVQNEIFLRDKRGKLSPVLLHLYSKRSIITRREQGHQIREQVGWLTHRLWLCCIRAVYLRSGVLHSRHLLFRTIPLLGRELNRLHTTQECANCALHCTAHIPCHPGEHQILLSTVQPAVQCWQRSRAMSTAAAQQWPCGRGARRPWPLEAASSPLALPSPALSAHQHSSCPLQKPPQLVQTSATRRRAAQRTPHPPWRCSAPDSDAAAPTAAAT
jgi:hypothetical protein